MESLFSILIGLLLGNFATTALYRIPRGIMIYGFNRNSTQRPFCSFCHHELKFYEYLPLLSWYSTKGKCNYCNHTIPWSYTALEAISATISLLCYFLFGFCDIYIMLVIFGLFSFLSGFIYLEHEYISRALIFAMIVLGSLYRTLIENTVADWLLDLSIAGILGLFLLKKFDNNNKEVSALVSTILIASMWVFGYSALIYALLLFSLYIYRFFIPNFKPYPLKLFPISIVLLYVIVLIQNINAYIDGI